MTRATTCLALSVAALASACAVDYKPPPEGVPTTALTLSTTTYGGAEFSSMIGCPSQERTILARLPFTLSGASLDESAKRSAPAIPVVANKPMTLVAAIAGTTCNWTAAFTPKSGTDYEAILHATNNTCRLAVYRLKPVAGGAPKLEPESGASYKRYNSIGNLCS